MTSTTRCWILACSLAGAALPAHTEGTPNPTVRFNSPGVKQVSLTVCNTNGCDAVQQQVTVLDPLPHILAMASVPARIGSGQSVTLDATTSGRPPLNHRWVVAATGLPSIFLPTNPAILPTLGLLRGSYEIKLEVDNQDGSTVSSVLPIDVVRMTFVDVPPSLGIWRFVETVAANGVTSGCGNGNYCPSGIVSREQMAVFLLRSKEGPTYTPPPCETQAFDDVPCTSPFAPWVNELAARGVTSGCGNGNYCPTAKTSRGQMAVFLLRAKEGPTYTPPACTIPSFADVPCTDPLASWINELAARGITGGCGSGNYCPTGSVNRGSMAVFLTATFTLPVPSIF
jgi:hypothetical protein